MNRRFLVVVEKAGDNYSAYSPDLPGCITTGDTTEEIMENMREAITLHLRGMSEDKEEVPEPAARAEYIDIIQQSNYQTGPLG